MKITILCFFFMMWGFISCRTKKESNLNIDSLSGVDLNGKDLHFKDIQSPRVSINVYSPTCIPCFKEIPTLNFLRREILKAGLGEFYMVVDPFSLSDKSEETSFEVVYAEVKSVMEEEKAKRNIELPILVMRPPFKVTPGKGLITGTPETLLFKTQPLILYYNFIGSISEKEDLEEIQNDPKVKFFKRVIGGI